MKFNTLPRIPEIEEDEGEIIFIENDDLELEDSIENDIGGEMIPSPIPDDAMVTFKMHDAAVFSCDLHPSKDWAVTGGADNTAYVWNIHTGEHVRTVHGHIDRIIVTRFSYNGTYLATGDNAGKIQVFKITGILKKVWEYSMGHMNWMFWHRAANVLFAGSERNGEIFVWRIPSGDCKILCDNGCKCETAELTNDGKKLLAGYANGSVKLWDIKSSRVEMEIDQQDPMSHTESVMALSCDCHSFLFMSGGKDGKIVFSNHTYPVGSVEASGPVIFVAFSPLAEMRVAVSGSLHGQIEIWDYKKYSLRTLCEPAMFGEHCSNYKLKWINDGTFIVSTRQGHVFGYDVRSGLRKFTLKGHSNDVYEQCYDSQRNILLTVSEDSTAKIFKIPQFNTLTRMPEIEEDEGEIIFIENDVPPEDEDDDLELEDSIENDIGGEMIPSPIPDDAMVTFKMHYASLVSCDLHPSKDWAVTGDVFNTVYVWNIQTGEHVRTLHGHIDSDIIVTRFSYDGTYLATGDDAGKIQVFKITGILKKVWEYSMGHMNWMFWHRAANVLFAGSERNGEIFVWRIPSGDCKILCGNGCKCETAELTNDGKKLLAGYANGSVKLWDIKSSRVEMEIDQQHPMRHTQSVMALSCDCHSSLFMSGGEDGKIVFSNHNGPVGSVEASGPVIFVAFSPSPEMRVAVSGSLHGQIEIWDYKKYSLRTLCEPAMFGVHCSNYKPQWINDGTFIVFTRQGHVFGYDVRSGLRKFTLKGHSYAIYDLCYDPQRNILLTVSEDFTAKIFKIPQFNTLTRMPEIEEDEGEIIFIENDVPPEDEDDDLELEDSIENDIGGEMIPSPIPDDAMVTFKMHDAAVFSCDLHPSKDWAVTGDVFNTVYVWNIQTGEHVRTLHGHIDRIIVTRFSYNGTFLATGDNAGKIQVFKITGILKKVWEYSMGHMNWMFWHRAAYVLFAGSERNGEIFVWRIPSGDCKILCGNGCKCETAELTNDGKKLLAGYANGSVKLWDIKSSRVEMEIDQQHPMRHTQSVMALSCDCHSSLFMSGGEDGKIVFSNHNGPVGSVEASGPVIFVAFSPLAEMRVAVSGSLHGQIQIWDYKKYSLRTLCEPAMFGEHFSNYKLKWINDGTFIVSTIQGHVFGYDVRSGLRKFTLKGHSNDVYEQCYDSQRNILLTVSEDFTAKIFKIPQFNTLTRMPEIEEDEGEIIFIENDVPPEDEDDDLELHPFQV